MAKTAIHDGTSLPHLAGRRRVQATQAAETPEARTSTIAELKETLVSFGHEVQPYKNKADLERQVIAASEGVLDAAGYPRKEVPAEDDPADTE